MLEYFILKAGACKIALLVFGSHKWIHFWLVISIIVLSGQKDILITVCIVLIEYQQQRYYSTVKQRKVYFIEQTHGVQQAQSLIDAILKRPIYLKNLKQ